MKTGLLTIFAVAISAALTAGNPHASETSTPNADAAETADSRVDAESEPAAAVPAPDSPAADQAAVDEGESVETADTVEAVEAANTAEPVETTNTAEPVETANTPQTEDAAESDIAVGVDSAAAANDEGAIDSELPGAIDEIEDAEALAETDSDLASPDAQPTRKVALGKMGYDEQGRSGRIHLVVSGDTLWDISDAYLGTPWVWPSVWTDNRDIENPHLIVPGDRIWISAHEMRRVNAEEAERLLAGQPQADDGDGEPAGPASDSFQTLLQDDDGLNTVRVSSLETTGLISVDQLEAAASIVDAVPERIMLSQGDQVFIGLGGQQASVGDQFTIFRTQEKVYDPDTNRLLGYHVELLGWAEVEETHSEASLALIRMSAADMEIGDRVMPRERPILDIEVAASPKNIDGRISFFPSGRVLMGSADYVYLNRGELDGLQVGSPLEVYRSGRNAPERARDTRVEVPDRVIAKLLVVRARRQSAVALIRHTETELELGDHFRGAAE
jgi:nucleoid-associated protein YgaU